MKRNVKDLVISQRRNCTNPQCSSEQVLIEPSDWNNFKYPTWVCCAKSCSAQERVVDISKIGIPEKTTYPFWLEYQKLCEKHHCFICVGAGDEEYISVFTADTREYQRHIKEIDPLH